MAGYLRQQGIPFVEVIPPTPYPAGPLGHAMVRVEHDFRRAARMLEEPRLRQPLYDPPFRPAVRLIAAMLVWAELMPILL